MAGVINCTAKINDPHGSSHVGGTVNVTDTVTCDGIVSSIAVTTKLFRSGIQVNSQNSFKIDTFIGGGNAAAPCLTAGYGGTADVTVAFPPGYTPAFESAHLASPVFFITC